MECPFFEIDGKDIYLEPFTALAPEGYELPKNADGQVFPDCCGYHKGILTNATDWFKKFPNCCPQHREMAKGGNFNIGNYPGVPQKIVQQVSYTEYQVCNRIEAEDWYDDITDYIEFNILSFGHPSVGSGLYFNYMLRYIKQRKGIPKAKRQQLLEYMNAKQQKAEERVPVSLNLLYSTYQKWLKALPLDLAIFKGKKEVLEQSIPILESQPHYNRYTQLTSAKLVTPVKMIEALVNATENLLRNIDSKQLVDGKIIPDINLHLLDLINETHRLKQCALLDTYTHSEIRYVTILKTWLENEKEYFKDLNNYFAQQQSVAKPVLSKQTILVTSLRKYTFTETTTIKSYSDEQIKKLIYLLANGSVAYQIALLNHIGFIGHLKTNYVRSDVKLFKALSEILGTTERLVKGNVYVLNPLSRENRNRYTAHLHTEQVTTDVENIK